MRVMALDYGAARTGVAVSDATGTLATPADRRRHASTATPASRDSSSSSPSRRPEAIVVGLPVSLDGREHGQAARARAFARRLAAATDVPVTTYDERFTTKVATQRGGRAPRRRARRGRDPRGLPARAGARARRRRRRAADARRAAMPDDRLDPPPDAWAPIERGRAAGRARRACPTAAAAPVGASSRSSSSSSLAFAVGVGVGAVRAYSRAGRGRRRGQGHDPRGLVPQADRRRSSPPKGVVEHASLFVYQVKDDGHEDDLKPGHLRAARERAVRRPRREAARGRRRADRRRDAARGPDHRGAGGARRRGACRGSKPPTTCASRRDDSAAGQGRGLRDRRRCSRACSSRPPTRCARRSRRARSSTCSSRPCGTNLDKVDMTRAHKANLTEYDVLIIASLIEGEARVAEERDARRRRSSGTGCARACCCRSTPPSSTRSASASRR